MRKILKLSLLIIQSILIFVFLMGTTIVIVEHIEVQVMIENFKNMGIYQEELSTKKYKYYKIPSSEESMQIVSFGDCRPGLPGDILCSVDQTTIAPIINEIVSFYAGGHAGFICGNYKDYEVKSNTNSVVESTTTNGVNTTTSLYPIIDWQTNKFFNSVIGLRVSMTEQEKKEVISLVTSYIDDPYNTSFIFDTVNKKYCTDLISQAFSYVGKDLNRDKFTVSIFDLIVSPDTYISYYHYFDSQGIKYIYYLG